MLHGRENGTSGLAVQLSHIAGNDHNVRFLAEGMWNEALTPEAFYRDYAATLFGAKAVETGRRSLPYSGGE